MTKPPIRIEVDDREVRQALENLQRRVSDLTPVMHDIGQVLVESMRARLRDGRDVEGRPFAPNTPLTLSRKKGTRPLVDSGMMAGTRFHYQAGRDYVEVGSNAIQAAVMHFGAKMGEFGRYSQVGRVRKYGLGTFMGSAGTKKGFPIPWGDIPARPFVGLSSEDKEAVLETITEALEDAARGGR